MACLLKNEPASYFQWLLRLRHCRAGAAAKASLNRAYRSLEVDPKLRDLPMARVKRR